MKRFPLINLWRNTTISKRSYRVRIKHRGKIYNIAKAQLIVAFIVLFFCSCLSYKIINYPELAGILLWVICNLLLYILCFWDIYENSDTIHENLGTTFVYFVFVWLIIICVETTIEMVFMFFKWVLT